MAILPALIDKGAQVRAHDPGVREAKSLLISYHDDIYDMLVGVDCVVLMTEWNQYRGLDLEECAVRCAAMRLSICGMFMNPGQCMRQVFLIIVSEGHERACSKSFNE